MAPKPVARPGAKPRLKPAIPSSKPKPSARPKAPMPKMRPGKGMGGVKSARKPVKMRHD